uniref:Uncharacterized protein n=1 Tax=Arundo donax TaxID=35708 RepID=A0A0A9A9K4_ARUDO
MVGPGSADAPQDAAPEAAAQSMPPAKKHLRALFPNQETVSCGTVTTNIPRKIIPKKNQRGKWHPRKNSSKKTKKAMIPALPTPDARTIRGATTMAAIQVQGRAG